jgi:hypothetical protein
MLGRDLLQESAVTDEQPFRDTRSFLFTDMRAPDGRLGTVLIYDLAAPELTGTTANPPEQGSTVQLNLGNLGWLDALVTSSSGNHFAARLVRAIIPGELVIPTPILSSELPTPS